MRPGRPATIYDLRELVARLLLTHGGGTTYFDALDAELREPRFVRMAAEFSRAIFPDRTTVVTGRFGAAVAALGSASPLLVLPGGLRHGPGETPLHVPASVAGQGLVLLDDSFYLGRTRMAVKQALRRQGAELAGTVVLYDGSLADDPTVHSLFKYHRNTH